MHQWMLAAFVALTATSVSGKGQVMQSPGTAPLWSSYQAQAKAMVFAWDLLHEAAKISEGNVTVAPIETLAMLAVLRYGSRGETEAALSQVMRIPNDAVMPELAVATLYKGLQFDAGEKKTDYVYDAKVGLTLDSRATQTPGISNFLKKYFASDLVDGASGELALSGSLAFKAAPISSSCSQTSTATAKVVRCDLSGQDYALTILPAQNGKKFVTVDAKLWTEINQSLAPTSVVILPKIESEATYDLVPVLVSMGGKDALGSTADFKGISPGSHKLTRATQNLAVAIGGQGAAPATPFVWIVHHKRSGLIILAGIVKKP